MDIETIKKKKIENSIKGRNLSCILTKEELDFLANHITEKNKSGVSVANLIKEFRANKRFITKCFKQYNHTVVNLQNQLSVREDLFGSISTEEDAYWLGFLYADGCITDDGYIHLSLKSTDKNHLEKFAKYINWSNKVKTYRAKCGNKTHEKCSVQFASQHLKSNFIKLGLVPRKSLILTFPTSEQVPSNLMTHFIRGYFEGDGHIKTRKNTISFELLGTYEFLEGLISFLNLEKSVFLIRKDKRHLGNTYRLALKTQKSLEIFHDMYDNATVYLDRKYEKFNEILIKRSKSKRCFINDKK